MFFNFSSKSKKIKLFNLEASFTLVELVTILGILGILIVAMVLVINPAAQLKKTRDARRHQDLTEMRSALDIYYNDYHAYPWCLSFGSSFTSSNTSYLKKIPNDPLCQDGNSCENNYLYVTDENKQWFVLFAKKEMAGSNFADCQFTCISLPNFSCYLERPRIDLNEYKFCVFGGDIKQQSCPYNTTSVTPFFSSGPTPTATPIPTVTPTPTPRPPTPRPPTPTSFTTPTPTPCGLGYYFCACGPFNRTVCNRTYTRPPGLEYYCDPQCSNQCGKPCN